MKKERKKEKAKKKAISENGVKEESEKRRNDII